MKPGDAVEVLFACNRGATHEPGVVRELRYHRDGRGEIRAVVVRLDTGRLCVVHPHSLRNVHTERA